MGASLAEHRVLLSFAREDAAFATRMGNLITELGAAILPRDESNLMGADIKGNLRGRLMQATMIIVLIGSTTRFSRWVDIEIEFSTKPTKEGPGAGLIGVVLPTHDDFSKPYYEPELVPLRLHDRILAEYAILRKWSDDPLEVADWLSEADRRRHQYDSTPSIRALIELRHFPWSKDADVQSSSKDIGQS